MLTIVMRCISLSAIEKTDNIKPNLIIHFAPVKLRKKKRTKKMFSYSAYQVHIDIEYRQTDTTALNPVTSPITEVCRIYLDFVTLMISMKFETKGFFFEQMYFAWSMPLLIPNHHPKTCDGNDVHTSNTISIKCHEKMTQ